MLKNFYLFRHGETEMNAVKVFQGSLLNGPLTERGRQQAEELREAMAGISVDAIYSSPMRRAYETAQILRQGRDVEILIEYDLIEGDHGEAQGLSKTQIMAKYPEIYEKWCDMDEKNMDCRFNKGESKREIQSRALNVLRKIAASPYRNIAVATHSMVLRCLLIYFGMKMTKVAHGKVFHLCYDGETFSLME